METTGPAAEKMGVEPEPWSRVALGVLPFLLIGLAILLMLAPVGEPAMPALQIMGAIFFLGGYLVILYGLLRGWLLGFPRWVYPYIVYSIIFAVFISSSSTPGLAILGIPLFGSELWGWRAFVPLGIVAVLALMISRQAWSNLARLRKTTWSDWTQISFGLYGLIMLALLVSMDEVERSFRFPPTLLAVVLVILGALGYMRLVKRWQRMGAMLICAGVSIAILLAAGDFFWQTHYMNFSTGESRVIDVAVDFERMIGRAASGAGIALLVLLVPLPVGLLHWLWKRFPTQTLGEK